MGWDGMTLDGMDGRLSKEFHGSWLGGCLRVCLAVCGEFNIVLVCGVL